METKLIGKNELPKAAELILNGETVVFPTETVYGLGADAFSQEAVLKIFAAKNRPADNPLIVHIASPDMIGELTVDFNAMAKAVAERFMPGPITLVMKKSERIPDAVSAGLSTVGIRFPDHPIAKEFIRLCQTPIAAPSANLSGTVSATTFADVCQQLTGRVGGIIEGDDCAFGIESTVVDVTGDIPVVLRPGSVTLEMLREVIPETRLHPSLISGKQEDKPASPGMKYKHYSPKADVVLVYGEMKQIVGYFDKNLSEKDCLFLFEKEYEGFSGNKLPLGNEEHLEEMAHLIFKQLKQADRMKYETVYIPAVEEMGIGLSIMNRLKKSSGGKKLVLR